MDCFAGRWSAASRPEVEKKVAREIASAAEESVESLLTPRQLLERFLAENPLDEAAHIRLADMLIADEQYEIAEANLVRAIPTCSESRVLLEKLEHVRDFQRQPATLESRKSESKPVRVPWLELTLALAVIGLCLQLVPSAEEAVWQIADVRNWSRVAWFLLNVGTIGLLLSFRFASSLSPVWQDLSSCGKGNAELLNGDV